MKYQTTLPDFSDLCAKDISSNVSSLIKAQREKIKNLLNDDTKPNFSLVSEIEEMHHKPVSYTHLTLPTILLV